MKSKPIFYSLEPFDLAGHRFRVTLTIPEPNPRGQIVSLPAWIPGSYLIRDFARQIETISARSGNRRLPVVKLDNHSWQIEPCAESLHITATVYAWDLSVRGAHLDETHGFFNGTSVYLRPHGFEELPCKVTLIAPALANWRVFTSLPQATQLSSSPKIARDYANGFGAYEALNYDDLIDHPVEMGRPQVVRFEACGAGPSLEGALCRSRRFPGAPYEHGQQTP